ncbi:hypothetical protein JB92DRAFT_3129159 [Gautieria morchelliformis]|nr:hypothetical protein JB92DRAFT_3129159 [Gautieria morchelliformis]
MFTTIERGPATSANQVQVSSTSSPSVLSKEISAYDLITCLSQEDVNRRITGDNLLATYIFPELPLLEFFRIVRIVSQYRPNYELDSTMCYWFSGVIIEVARRRFVPHHPGNRPVSADPPRGAGYYTVIDTMTSQWTKDYNIIEQIYEDDCSTNDNPIGPQLELARQRERDARDEGVQQGLQQGEQERGAAAERERALIAEVRSLQAQLRRGGATGAMNVTDCSPRKHIRPTGE